MKGEAVEGVAILSFPSMEAARAWYSRAGYQAALLHRLNGSTSHVIPVEGTDAPTADNPG